MSFVVRQISRAADGREIIRPRAFDGDALSIGRNTASDIHLPDLAVTLDHAVLTRDGPDTIRIDAVNDLPFDANGRSTAHAELDVRQPNEVRIGGHRLSIQRDAATGDTVISVERVEALSDASEAKEEARSFGLAGKLPSKRAMAWTFALVVLALFLAWPILADRDTVALPKGASASQIAAARGGGYHPDSAWSSGPLSRAHANLQANCQACHVRPFESVRDESCAACHADVHDHADPRRLALAKAPPTMGGRVRIAVQSAFGIPQGRCVDCHTEHEGPVQMAATPQMFCTDCHASLSTRLTDTRIGDAGDFGTAHPQFRATVVTGFTGRTPAVSRVSLDANPKEANGLKFPHAVHLSTTNSVARMTRSLAPRQGWGDALACKDCHVAEAGGTRFRPVDMETNCAACHSLAFDRSADGTVRTLRHGQPAQVVAELRDYFRLNGPARPAVLSGMARRRPGEAATRATAADYYLAVGSQGSRANQAIRAVFSPGGACYDCHTVTPATDPARLNFAIAPVVQPTRYTTKG